MKPAFFYNQTVVQLYRRFLTRAFYTSPFPLPAVSSPGRLHAVSFTRTFRTPVKGFTRRFRYTRIQSSRNFVL